MLTHVIIAWLTIFIYSDNAIIVLNNISSQMHNRSTWKMKAEVNDVGEI